MNDNELWSAIIGILAAIVVRVLDHYFPGIGHVTQIKPTDRPSATEGRHRAHDDGDTDDSAGPAELLSAAG